jgi:hypothetical protein
VEHVLGADRGLPVCLLLNVRLKKSHQPRDRLSVFEESMMESSKRGSKKYGLFLATFLGITVALTVISVLARLSVEDPSTIQSIVLILGLLVTFGAGWITIRTFRLRLRHCALLGLVLSFGSHWSLPIFHKGPEIVHLILLNSIIMAAIAFFGGCSAIVFEKVIRRRWS